MAQRTAVHIELQGEAWAVVREGNQRATSTHSTQAEAAEAGRDLARRDKTEFFLHGQDGQIREHRDYRAETAHEDEGIIDTALGTVGTVTEAADGITGTAAQALVGDDEEARHERFVGRTGDLKIRPAGREADRPGSITGSTSDPEGFGHGPGVAGREPGGSAVAPEEKYADYAIYDRAGERLGSLHDLFVDESDEPEYLGVGTGSPTNRSVLVPAEVVTFNDGLRRVVVSRPRSVVETGPSLGYDEEVTRELERRIRLHYGLAVAPDHEERTGLDLPFVDIPERTGGADAEPGLPGREEEEVRVRRSEEEIRVDTREREAGAMRVRKRVRTDRERIEVPKKRVEVTVERVPVEGAASTAGEVSASPEIREEEIVVPVVEEEVVVEKRPVVKEEIRIRKQVVEEVEVVEEEVRKEEVEIDDETGRDTGV
jgi:uncharacterized protein (TIGR02271 family)